MIWMLYAVDVVIVATYLNAVLGFRPSWDFDWANALGGPILVALTIATAGWQPILLLTITFTVAGWIGLLKGPRND